MGKLKALSYLLALAILISVVTGCKEDAKQINDVQDSEHETQTPDIEKAIQLILDVPDLQMWLHGESPERVPLKLLMNESIMKDYQLQKFGERVRIVDSAIIKKEQFEDAIRIRIFDSQKDTLRFSLYHHIEGAVMQGRLYISNDQWRIIVDGIGEE